MSRRSLVAAFVAALGLALAAGPANAANTTVCWKVLASQPCIKFVVGDTEAGLPSSGVPEGVAAWAKDSDQLLCYYGGSWQPCNDGGTSGGDPTLAGDVDGSGSANDLDEAAVESELESVLDLSDLQGAVTDGQVPNSITVDLAAAATALAANGSNCSAASFPLGVDASGAVESCSASISGNAATATALATNPADCSTADGTEFAWRINAAGDLSCSSVAYTSKTLDRKTSATTIVSSGAETTVYSYTIPAGTVDANGELRLTLLGEYLNNTGSARGYTVKIKLGGTTVIEYASGSNFSSSANRRGTLTAVYLSALGATNSQIVTLVINHSSGTGAFGTLTTGTGSVMSTTVNQLNVNSGTLSQDMTASKTLEVTITLSSSGSSHQWKTNTGTLELLNP